MQREMICDCEREAEREGVCEQRRQQHHFRFYYQALWFGCIFFGRQS